MISCCDNPPCHLDFAHPGPCRDHNDQEVKRYAPAAWVVMGLPSHGERHVPIAVRPTEDEAFEALVKLAKDRRRAGWSAQGCAMFVMPTEEQVEVKPS